MFGSSADADLDQRSAPWSREPPERRDVLRPDVAVAHQVDLRPPRAAAPRRSGRARSPRQAIEVRQLRRRRRRAASSAGCARNASAGRRRTRRARTGRGRRHRSAASTGPTRSPNVPAVERGLELVLRKDRHAVEQRAARARTARASVIDDRARVRRGRPAAACPSTIDAGRERAVDRRVVRARNENTTSAEVNGAPSENLTPSRSVSV